MSLTIMVGHLVPFVTNEEEIPDTRFGIMDFPFSEIQIPLPATSLIGFQIPPQRIPASLSVKLQIPPKWISLLNG